MLGLQIAHLSLHSLKAVGDCEHFPSLPDEVGENPEASVATEGVSLSRRGPAEPVNGTKGSIPNMLRGQKQHAMIPDEVGRSSLPLDGQTLPENGRAKAQVSSVGEREKTAKLPCRSCVHLQVPPRISSSIFFLDKSLLISLEGLCGGGAGRGGEEVENRTSYRSTLSVRLSASPRGRLPAFVEKKKDERSKGRSGRAPTCDLKGPEVKPSAPACRVGGGFGDSEKRCLHPQRSLPLPGPHHFQEQQEDTDLRHQTPSRSESEDPGSRSVHYSFQMQIPPRAIGLCYARHAHDTSTLAAVL